jgi:hypothetical protein
MKFALWNLRVISDGYLDGPESTIVERGGSAVAIWTSGASENGASILGKVSGDLSGLEEWNFFEVSRQQAEEFIEQNFIPYLDEEGVEQTLANALLILN